MKMKLQNWVAIVAMNVAIVFIATGNPTWAGDSMRQSELVSATTYGYDGYQSTNVPPAQQGTLEWADTKSPQGSMPAYKPVADETSQPAADSSQEASSTAQMACPSDPPKPWHIPQPCIFQAHNIDMGGWVEQGITFNNLRPADRFNGPQVTNDRDREYQLNQAWLYFNRPTNTDGCGFDLGGRIDMCYGTDWRFGQCYGLENRFDDSNSFYGLVLPQFYAEVAINNLTVKAGHFATFTSYEVVPAPLNFFYSHTYLMGGYFDPLLVTGVQADYNLGHGWKAIGGINRGELEFEDPDNTWNFLGGLKWTSSDKKETLSLMTQTGPDDGFTGVHERDSVFIVYTDQLTDRLQYATQIDVGQEKNGSVVTPGQNANWYGLEEVLIYKLNAKWSAGVRYEWIRDEEGSRIFGIGKVLLTDKGWDGPPGFAGSFQDVTLGLNWRPHPNVVFGPEVRWDFYDGPANPVDPTRPYPFGDHERTSQFTFATNMIVTF
jgi:hypothetical protein